MDNMYSQMILNLAIVLSLMVLLMYVGKKLKSRKTSHNKHIKIINVTPIGTKEKIILMEVNNTILLVGSTPNRIETLYVFNELEQPKPTTESTEKPNFSDHLATTLN